MIHAPARVERDTLLKLYASLFVGRWSDFALQQRNGRYLRAGRALTSRDLYLHLQGQHTIGTYVQNEHGYCTAGTADDDTPEGLQRLQLVQARLAHDRIVSYLEASRRGGHLWVFLDKPLLASRLRAWLLPYMLPGMEFYPKQAEGIGYGSVIRLPLGIHRVTGQRYPFLVSDGQELRAFSPDLHRLSSWLRTLTRVVVPAPQTSTPEPITFTQQSFAPTAVTHLSYAPQTIHTWCALQNPFQVIGQFVPLDQRGMGHCPFHEHHAHGDCHPSFKVYEPRRVGGSSWFCYAWNQGGDVFDFLCHWYKLDARTMWHRIQKGHLS